MPMAYREDTDFKEQLFCHYGALSLIRDFINIHSTRQ